MASVFGDSGISRAQVGAMLHPGYPAAHFQVMHEGGVASAAIGAADTLYLYPFRVYAPFSANLIFERVQTVGAASAVKCAVWRNGAAKPTGVPLLGQNVGFDTATGAGIKSEAVTATFLPPGVYWAGSKATGTMPAMLGISASAAYQIPIADLADAMPGPTIMVTGFSVSDAYANNIMATDLTGASFSRTSTGVPVIGLGWV